MKILVTGVAGFIGMNLCIRLLNSGLKVVGIDNISDYYDVSLKEDRIKKIFQIDREFNFYKVSLSNINKLKQIFENHKFDCVVNLAAQAGVRYSIDHPQAYIESNISGFLNILEECRFNQIKHLIYASSSSVYGMNEVVPSIEHNNTDHPVSLYAATKKSNELMAHAYSNLYSIPTTGLRFFTVYGPWGRPDMAPHIFANALNNGSEIKLFNNGNMIRDFTFIDDVTKAITKLINIEPDTRSEFYNKKPNLGISSSNYKIFNIGNNNPISVKDFIKELEIAFKKKTIKKMYPMQLGDVRQTYADCSKLYNFINFSPKTNIGDGVNEFVKWYKEYYKI
ncbi:NAD-dependent epimerase/dehydratase family protein [Alphaproteobacteria bacterium]|nr:NAD-dependent epimerase/dehydratase family protein [Alphaproteobacteria bacterium]